MFAGLNFLLFSANPVGFFIDLPSEKVVLLSEEVADVALTYGIASKCLKIY